MRSLKLRAAQSDRRLKDGVTEFLQRGLAEPDACSAQQAPTQALRARLTFYDDGTVTHLEGIDEPKFFASLDRIREDDRQTPPAIRSSEAKNLGSSMPSKWVTVPSS